LQFKTPSSSYKPSKLQYTKIILTMETITVTGAAEINTRLPQLDLMQNLLNNWGAGGLVQLVKRNANLGVA